MSQRCCFSVVVDVGELMGMTGRVCLFGLNHLIELSPAVHRNLSAMGLILADNQSAAICLSFTAHRLHLLQLLTRRLQFRQTLLLLQTPDLALLSDIVCYLYKNGNSRISLNRPLPTRHLPVGSPAIFAALMGRTQQGFSQLLLRLANSFPFGGRQLLQAELPTALLLRGLCLVQLLWSAVAMLAPSEHARRGCPLPHRAANGIVARELRFGLLFRVLLLEVEQFGFEAELTVEELEVLDVWQLLWLGGRFPNPGGFCLHQRDVLLALLDFSAVKGRAFTLNHAALDQFREHPAAEDSSKVVRLLFLLVSMMHIEIQKIASKTTSTQRAPKVRPPQWRTNRHQTLRIEQLLAEWI